MTETANLLPPGGLATRLRHAQNHAGLVWVLSRKNFKVRYKRAALGIVWAVVQPAFQAALLSFVFIKIFRIARVPHYPLYVLSGLLLWSFFTSSVTAATTAVVDNANLVRKVAIPLSVFPIAAVGGAAMAFSASLIVLAGATTVTGLLSWKLALLPIAVALELLLIIGVALVTGAFHVAFRDVKYLVESGLLLGLYATPILYDLDRVPAGIRGFIQANPMTGVLSLSRAAVLGRPLDDRAVLTSVAVTMLLLVVGSLLFRRRSGEFADLV